MKPKKRRNLIAKYAGKFNRATTFKDRKREASRRWARIKDRA